MNAWVVVECNDLMKPGPSMILKVKACCCACGDQQLEWIDFFETYSPVLHWTMYPLMLILENPISLKSKKADFTATFLHDILEEDDKVYVEMPLGFKQQGSNGKLLYVSRKVKVLMPSGNILLRNLITVAYLKLL
ncbi:LOW QUALITY PROTEIN: hypothetical protein ACHAXS_000904 [Conticribra weissflogii]